MRFLCTSGLHYSGSACWFYWQTKGSCSPTLVVFWQRFSFSLSFFSCSNNDFVFLFPEIGGKYFSIFISRGFTLDQIPLNCPRMVCFNHRSLMILVSDAKYIYLLPIFSYSWNNFIRILLISLKILVKLIFCDRIIHILYSLNKYTSVYST